MTKTILEQLDDAQWRGIAFPFTGVRDWGFSQEQAPHRYIFRDQQLIESLGQQNPVFRYNIPFREGLRASGWINLFTQTYPEFLQACLDRSAGDLLDPVHGLIRAKCLSLSESLDVEKKDGVDVVAEFVFAPESADDSPTQFTTVVQSIEGLRASAIEFGATAMTLSAEQRAFIDSLNEPAKRADVSIFDAGRVVATSVQQQKNRTRAQLNRAAWQMEQTREEIEQAQDPQLEELRRDASRVTLASRRLAVTSGDPTKPYRIVRASAEIGRVAFATANGVTTEELIEFNPWIADVQLIPAGQLVRIPRKDT